MSNLKMEIVNDLKTIEDDLGQPTFVWQGNTYNLIPSITDFNRELDTGGFKIVKLLTATVRRYEIDDDETLTDLFSNGLPLPQQLITYSLDGTKFRIESIKSDPTGAYFRIIAHSSTKGI